MQHLTVKHSLYREQYTDEYLVLATTNANIMQNGENIMGGGNARGLADYGRKYGLNIPYMLGQTIKEASYRLNSLRNGVYGQDYYLFIWSDMKGFKQGFGCLQTKRHVAWNSPMDLVIKSIDVLSEFATAMPEVKTAMPPPGIGLGGLQDKAKEVEDYCKKVLPDNVYWVILDK